MTPETISHYRIIEKLGQGGMGEVFLAEDTRLGRKVVLKFLSEKWAGDPERLARLEREARVASSLNHPNIVVIHEVEREGDVSFLAQEYVEGETLRARLLRGKLNVSESLDIASQLLHALSAAHAAGVIHRDIKPENVMLRPDGFVKLLDFGLAKPTSWNHYSEEAQTVLATMPGEVLGTVPYMSPEQARGLQIDGRSDLFSLGIVLYEMIAGNRPFAGPTATDILVQILDKEPGLISPDVPDLVRDLLSKALSKDPNDRYQTAEEMDAELKRVKRELESEPTSTLPRLTQVTFAEGIEQYPQWSADGARLVFSREELGIRKLWIKHTETGEEVRVTRGNYDEIQPVWCTGTDSLLFVRGRNPKEKMEPRDVLGAFDGGDIWALDMKTGKETRLFENAFNPCCSPDGRFIAFDASWAGPRRIWIADRYGHNPQQITSDTSEDIVHVRPRWSPGGERIVFQNIERTKFDIRVVDLQSRKMEWVTYDFVQDLNPVWSPSGKFIYFSSYRSGGLNLWRVRVAEDGRPIRSPQQLTAGAGQDLEPALDAVGRRLAFSILRQNADIWRLPFDPQSGKVTGGAGEQVIATTREDSRGSWSPDGRMIAFNSDRTGEMNIWLHSFDSAAVRQLTKGPGGDFQPNWSPDGKWLAFFSSRAGTPDIWTVEIATGKLRQLTQNESINVNPFYSLDGRHIAFQSDQSGRPEVWVMNADGSNQRRLTSVGCAGHFLRWLGDTVLFFSPYGGKPRLLKIALDQQEPEILTEVAGGAHISFSPDHSFILDVVGHKSLWITPLQSGSPSKIFEFDDPGVRIDYPLLSPDGKWVLFDRFKPQGGDIWMMQISE